MRILIFNWKDIRNPEAGGAEVFTHEVARIWAASGDQVTVFSRAFRGGSQEEKIDGVQIVRRGGRWSVYREAHRWYKRYGAGRFDLVIDEINTRPFMTPEFVRDARVVAFIHQLAAEVWTEEMPFPVGIAGRYVVEPYWLRRYCGVQTITVSPSTESDLRRLKFRNVTVVPVGRSVEPLTEVPQKERLPTLLFVGRLVRTKRPDHAISAHHILRRRLPDTQLWMIGEGYMRTRVQRLAGPGVTFFGRVSEEEKYDLMRRAHLLVVPGVREGWGLVVVEGNAMGTPAVGYRIPGLVDAIRDGDTGTIVDPGPQAIAEAAWHQFRTPSVLRELSRAALAWAGEFTWQRTAEVMRQALERGSLRV